jgi:hypothetical protein
MDAAGVQWWLDAHFAHGFARQAVTLSDDVLCRAALWCLQGVPSSLFHLREQPEHDDSATTTTTNTNTDTTATTTTTPFALQFELRADLQQLILSTHTHGAAVVGRAVERVTRFGTLFRRLSDLASYVARPLARSSGCSLVLLVRSLVVECSIARERQHCVLQASTLHGAVERVAPQSQPQVLRRPVPLW